MQSLNLWIDANIGVVVVALAAVTVVAVFIAARAYSGTRAVTQHFPWLQNGDSQLDTLPVLLQTVERNASDIASLKSVLDVTISETKSHLKHIGLVRYDAFDGVAGQQSYSLCLLDDHRSGFLITTLVGANFSRSYAVEIKAGEASRQLGDEEVRALSEAGLAVRS